MYVVFQEKGALPSFHPHSFFCSWFLAQFSTKVKSNKGLRPAHNYCSFVWKLTHATFIVTSDSIPKSPEQNYQERFSPRLSPSLDGDTGPLTWETLGFPETSNLHPSLPQQQSEGLDFSRDPVLMWTGGWEMTLAVDAGLLHRQMTRHTALAVTLVLKIDGSL